MLAIERREQILELLREQKRVLVGELSRQYSVSEETIRRDLERLEREGYATKTYGGAVFREEAQNEPPFSVREKTNVREKQSIAALVADLLRDGERIMLDESSTSVFIARQIAAKRNLTLITNSLEVMLSLSSSTGWNILSTGGSLKANSLALVGNQAENMIRTYHVNTAIISCKGLDEGYGLSDAGDDSAQIKRAMIDAADRVILAVDHSKFDHISFVKLCDLQKIDLLVTDREPGPMWQELFREAGVECLFPAL